MVEEYQMLMNLSLKDVVVSLDTIQAWSRGLFRVVLSKGVGNGMPPTSVLMCSDQVFIKRFVMKPDKLKLVNELITIFTGEGSHRHTTSHNNDNSESLCLPMS